jgi:hypothetical protein
MKPHLSHTILSRVQARFAKFSELPPPFDPQGFETLKQDVLFILQVGNLLNFCEKDTIYGLFRINNFSLLPDANRIETTLRDNMLAIVKNVYLAAAQRIKNNYKKGKLTDKEQNDITGGFDNEGHEIPGLAHHILGVFTSLLQMYFATHYEPIRLDAARLQLGSRNVTQELAAIFKRLHPELDDEATFRKWAFISLFHDIAKIEESYSVLKHDVTSARFLQKEGILEMLLLPPPEKAEAEVIIEKHVEIGCHGPGDHSIASLKLIFEEPKLVRLFTHDGGNVNPERLERLLFNALLMWTHDAAGTTRRGLATILPFDYLREVFESVIEIARPRNLDREAATIKRDLEKFARCFLRERMGRIICAWLYSESAKDGECGDYYSRALERIEAADLGADDVKTFEEYFPLVSGKNHLFNMLVLPVRAQLRQGVKMADELAESYQSVVQGFVLLTRAVKMVQCDDVRAVNAEGRMELNEGKRTRMAQQLWKVLDQTRSVSLAENGQVVNFVGKDQMIIDHCVEMTKAKDEETGKDVLLVRISPDS